MIPVGSLATHYAPSPRASPRPMKAAPPQPPSHGSLFRKTGRFLGGSTAAREQQQQHLVQPPSRESDATTLTTASTDRPGTLTTVTESSSESHSLRPGTSRHRRGSSVSSLTDIGSSIRRRSTSLRGHAPRSPESNKLAPPTNPRDARPSTATGDYKTQYQPNAGFVFQRIQDLATKRISTLDYMKKAHEGRTYWFNTLYFHRADLAKLPYFEQQKLVRRATNFFMLGNSIPPVLDPNADNLVEYLRTFNALLTEFDTYQTLHPPDGSAASTMSRVRMPHMFKRVTSGGGPQGKGRRASEFGSMAAASESTDNLSQAGGHGGPGIHSELGSGQDYAYLLTPSLPFDPDYFETFATLCDVLIDCYTTILGLVTSPETVGPPAAAELFSKVDLKLKKILVTGVVRDFEQASKQGVRSEMAGVGKVVLGGLM